MLNSVHQISFSFYVSRAVVITTSRNDSQMTSGGNTLTKEHLYWKLTLSSGWAAVYSRLRNTRRHSDNQTRRRRPISGRAACAVRRTRSRWWPDPHCHSTRAGPRSGQSDLDATWQPGGLDHGQAVGAVRRFSRPLRHRSPAQDAFNTRTVRRCHDAPAVFVASHFQAAEDALPVCIHPHLFVSVWQAERVVWMWCSASRLYQVWTKDSY